MKITAERQPESQVLLEIEVEPERVEKSMDQAFRRLAPKYRIPGFRPGKAPRIMFERYVGRDALMREALEKLVPQVYEEAVKEESLDPIDQPQFEIPTFEPLLIKATVPVRPTVDLGDYRGIRIERDPVEGKQEDLDNALLNLRKRYATLEPVDRPAQAGDIIRADVKAEVEGREILNEEDADLRLSDEGMHGLPGLQEKLVGCEKGQDYGFEVDVPDDYEEAAFAGKRATYSVHLKEIKEEHLPGLDDGFAREVGEGFDSMASLQQRVADDLRARAQEQAEREYETKVIEAVIAQASLEYPPVLVEREIEHILNEQTGGAKLASIENALRRTGGSLDGFRGQARPLAVDRVRRSLVLTTLAETEGLSVDDADVEEELERIVGGTTPQNARMRELFDTPSGRELLGRTVLTRKVYARLRDITEGKELPPLPEKREVTTEAATEASNESTGPSQMEGLADETATLTAETIIEASTSSERA